MRLGNAIIVLVLIGISALFADDSVFEIPAIKVPKLDGVIDISEWQGAVNGNLFELIS